MSVSTWTPIPTPDLHLSSKLVRALGANAASIVHFIDSHKNESGWCESQKATIHNATGITGYHGVHYQLAKLEERGVIVRAPSDQDRGPNQYKYRLNYELITKLVASQGV